MADADATIKAITALHLLGRSYKVMDVTAIKDRDFASNCNLLLSFVHSPKPAMYNDQIVKCIQLISDEWWGSDSPLIDDRVKKLHFSSNTIESIPVLLVPSRCAGAHSNVESL
jgi:hypothetical protein